MSTSLSNQRSTSFSPEHWDGEYKEEIQQTWELISKEQPVIDSDWEWGQVLPSWQTRFESCGAV
ncbi:hypothetical protein [Roseofilum casamattae]|uniref:Uncharacterized protein n=1 Tax=Roseofilum casamattae BLCC-M143 TaxID=3022442 RepID=A0ABT7BU95_9CYAN|nr:hypothetical protein [Roseofilum casamattae]MDJ1182759.1 hypothetical protein [Roseofilum casamattae BLCC-M143]